MRPRSNVMRPPLFFRFWFAFIFTAILCIWGLVGFGIYTAITNPEAIGQHVGRAIGGAVKGYQSE